nr:MAG: capsid precursor protein [Nodaviridae sp.]
MRVSTIPAAVNTASRMRSTQPKQMNLFSNTDRLYHTTLPRGAVRGSVIYDQVITPGIGRRLRQQAALFQKIKYKTLRFEVQTQTPTANGGGYVVAFLHDPAMEVGTGESALRALTAVQGTQTAKFWQSTVMSVQTTTQQYFTLNGNDIRLFSPGRFVVLSDGPPTEDVSITILFHWTVELTRPALQRPLNQLSQAVLVASQLWQDGEFVRYANWTGGANFVPPKIDTSPENLWMENAFTGLPPAQAFGANILFYQTPYPVKLAGNEVLANFIGFRVDSDGHIRGSFYQLPGAGFELISTATPTQGYMVMVQNVRLTPVMADEFYGTTESTFLANVTRSVSVNQLPTICKSFQQVRLTGSSASYNDKETLQDKLSTLRDRFWDPELTN